MKAIQHYINLHSFHHYNGQFMPVENLEEALKFVVEKGIKSEIIGNWLYCFTNDMIGVQLISIGFWYSLKHNAFVYSGGEKEPVADEETLDEIRSRLGSQKVEVAQWKE